MLLADAIGMAGQYVFHAQAVNGGVYIVLHRSVMLQVGVGFLQMPIGGIGGGKSCLDGGSQRKPVGRFGKPQIVCRRVGHAEGVEGHTF